MGIFKKNPKLRSVKNKWPCFNNNNKKLCSLPHSLCIYMGFVFCFFFQSKHRIFFERVLTKCFYSGDRLYSLWGEESILIQHTLFRMSVNPEGPCGGRRLGVGHTTSSWPQWLVDKWEWDRVSRFPYSSSSWGSSERSLGIVKAVPLPLLFFLSLEYYNSFSWQKYVNFVNYCPTRCDYIHFIIFL